VQKTKVLHVLWSGRSGGAERFVRDITLHLDRDRFENTVIFLSEGGWLADSIAENGTKVFYLGMRNGFSFLAALKVLRVLRAVSPRIVHIHCRNFLINLILILFCRVPCVYFEHGGNLIGDHPEKEAVFYRLFGSFFKVVLANSEYVRSRVIKVSRLPPGKVKTFYIGIDPVPYDGTMRKDEIKSGLGIPSANKVVGIVGRLTPAKGMDDFIKICAQLDKLKGDGRYTYLIVGNGPLLGELEKLAAELHVDIKFLGDRQDVPQMLKAFDVFVFTSKWESFGIVLLEAMAAKVPVVGFDVPGASEVISKGGGVMIEERNLQKAAGCVIDVLENPEKRKKLAEEGYENMQKYFNIGNAMCEVGLMYESLGQKQ
jgi:glycosyltransferase involved in cell wall biosynthesis